MSFTITYGTTLNYAMQKPHKMSEQQHDKYQMQNILQINQIVRSLSKRTDKSSISQIYNWSVFVIQMKRNPNTTYVA